jgi:itaconyl-CoA hydratase
MSFYSYDRTTEGYFLERFGLSFEDFQVGQYFYHRPGLTVSQQDNAQEALLSMNAAMIHYDHQYSDKTAWKKPLVVSTITLQHMIGMSSKTFAKKKKIRKFDSISMTAPVFGDDTLYVESEIIGLENTQDDETGLITVQCIAKNQNNAIVAKVIYQALIWKRFKGPLMAPPHISSLIPAEEPRFFAFKSISDQHWIEQTGLFFEDFNPNETFIHWPCKTFNAFETVNQAFKSMEHHPQFHDSSWLSNQGEAKFAIPQTWLLGAGTALTTRTFGRVVANLGWHDAEFFVDVELGDTIQAQSTVLEKRESKSRPNEGILTVSTTIYNQHRHKVISYIRNLLVYKKTAETPYHLAGY